MIQCKFWCQRTRLLAAMGAMLLHGVFALRVTGQEAPLGTGSATAPAGQTLVTNLQAIVIVPKAEDVKQEGLAGVKGIIVKGPAFLRKKGFEKTLKPYL